MRHAGRINIRLEDRGMPVRKIMYRFLIVWIAVHVSMGIFLTMDGQAWAQEALSEDGMRYETLVSSLFGRRALRHTLAADADEAGQIRAFWMETLAFDCKTRACTQFQWSDESLWRVMGLSADARSQALMTLLSAYASGARTATDGFMEQEIQTLFENIELPAQDRLDVYAAMIPLMKQHAVRSNDQIRFKKLQAAETTFGAHAIPTDMAVECRYGADEARTLWIRFPVYDWVLRHGFEPEVGIMETPAESLVSLFCQVVAPDSLLAEIQADHGLDQAVGALHQALASRDQDSIDMSGNSLLMAIRQAREERGWAVPFNPFWRGKDLKALLCRCHTLMLQLLAQDRFVMASRLDAALGELFPGTEFYARLKETASCLTRLDGSYHTLLRSEYETNASVYDWVLTHFDIKKRAKIEKTFADWTRRIKPNVRKVRRGIASFTAWTIGERALAGKFAQNMTDRLSRANNPQVYGYDLAMAYVRGEVLSEQDLAQRLDALYQKSPAHMFDTLTFARQFMREDERRMAASLATAYHVSPAPVAAAVFQAAYIDEITRNVSPETSIRVRLWTLELARYAWRGAERERFAEQLLALCRKAGHQACVEHLAGMVLRDPMTTEYARAYWKKQATTAVSDQDIQK